ncbi:uncharacterized protein At1g76070-like [Salvia miltiorrhiza]|uniref:uncharacterized protein At1g76070-like n=1 Tax=Salvia miltiorrhiza TaxID=226208 RepID=UPI0025AD750B|nr:uncharacterized protein At1g76070-like [Salvia miltiorrhiza]
MEKANNHKLRNKILKLLPKAISFQNIPFSPRRDSRPDAAAHSRPRAHHNKAFSGPMIPAEARRKLKSRETFSQEPTSPKVSCTGRVKHRGRISEKKKKPVSLPKEFKPVAEGPGPKKKAGIKKFLAGGRKCAEQANDRAGPGDGSAAPSLGHMRRFASSREAFANFDWTAAQIAPGDCSDDERGYSDGDEEEEECRIPFSAPMMMMAGGGDLEPKKEINLWKRRTMAQPRSLELNMDE